MTTGHNISCVVTQPDRKKDRGLHLGQTPVKIAAGNQGIKIYQPQKINSKEALDLLSSLKPELFIVIAYGQILSEEILAIPSLFAINLHASLLPKYRGAAPINWSIIRGEKITGVSIIQMAKKMDAGPIILQKETEIAEDETAMILEEKLSRLGAQLLLESLGKIEKGDHLLVPQEENNVSFAPKLKKEDGLIDWGKSAEVIRNLTRGCLEWPGAFTYYKGKLTKIYRGEISAWLNDLTTSLPGDIIEVSEEGIAVACGEGTLIIKQLQIEGKRITQAKEFIHGHRVRVGEKFYKK